MWYVARSPEGKDASSDGGGFESLAARGELEAVDSPARTLDPLLVGWLPELRYQGQRSGHGTQWLVDSGDPDIAVQATENGWLSINTRSRGVELDSPVAGRFDVMQRWIAWYMAPARMAGLFPWSRANEAWAAEPTVPEMVPAPDAPFTAAVEDARHSLLLQNGEVVARLVDHPSNGVLTPYANRLTHYAYVPLPPLLDQLSRPAGSQGSVFPRAADEWGNRLRLPLAAQQLEAQRLRAAFRDLTGL